LFLGQAIYHERINGTDAGVPDANVPEFLRTIHRLGERGGIDILS